MRQGLLLSFSVGVTVCLNRRPRNEPNGPCILCILCILFILCVLSFSLYAELRTLRTMSAAAAALPFRAQWERDQRRGMKENHLCTTRRLVDFTSAVFAFPPLVLQLFTLSSSSRNFASLSLSLSISHLSLVLPAISQPPPPLSPSLVWPREMAPLGTSDLLIMRS